MKMEEDDDCKSLALEGKMRGDFNSLCQTGSGLLLLLSITRMKPAFCPSQSISNPMSQCQQSRLRFKLCSAPLALGHHYPWNTIKHMQNEPAASLPIC